ncbi:MAG: MT-A70 family methyltransferase, partial [Candidatus Limnocylindrales bacterium]
GFEPKTILTWAKDRMGTGDWLRGQTEHCLMCVRGHPTVTLTNQTTLLHGPMREHSRKPDEFFTLVESLCPGSKLELFAREARPGWAAWGAEAA